MRSATFVYHNIFIVSFSFLIVSYIIVFCFIIEVKPELGQVPNSSGLANTLNPMKNPNTALNSTKADATAGGEENDLNKKQVKRKHTRKALEKKKVVLVKGIFKIDPRLTFVPDWM